MKAAVNHFFSEVMEIDCGGQNSTFRRYGNHWA